MRAEILLSYYHGEQYIREQLQSILDQTFSGEICIRIRNDGTDAVKLEQILTGFQFPANRNVIVDSGENLGPQRSFLKLIQQAGEADYYFYADQDDVWLADKVQRAVEAMEGMKQECRLYCGNYTITDSNLNVICESGVELQDTTFRFLRALLFNTFPGCTMGMNAALMKVLKKLNLENCMMHDGYTFATVLAVGAVYYDPVPCILHRIHQDNVVGYGSKKIVPWKWLQEKAALLIHREAYDLAEFANRLWEETDGNPEHFKADVCLLKDYRKSRKNTWKLLTHPDLKHKLDRCGLSIYCKIWFRLF